MRMSERCFPSLGSKRGQTEQERISVRQRLIAILPTQWILFSSVHEILRKCCDSSLKLGEAKVSFDP